MTRFFYLSLSLLLMAGCVGSITSPASWRDKTVDLVWPEAPEQPRIRYLRSLYGLDDLKEESKTSGALSWLLGESQWDPALLSPYAVASSRVGAVWVADNVAKMLYRFDMKRQKIDYFKSLSGFGLISPSGVVVDDVRQRVYLADAGLGKVFVLDDEGGYLDQWAPPGGFRRPVGLALDVDGRLLVADALEGLVYIFSPEGTMVTEIRSQLNSDGRFVRPLNVASGPNGEILVLDAFSFRVEVLDAQGALLGSIGQLGDAAGYLARPKGLAVDRAGHVFVSDSAFDNIQVFDMAGNLLLFWGRTGSQPGEFNLPAGLFVDHEDRLLVADSYNHRIQAFQLLH